MAVYVDQARHRYGRMIMCHMVADTPEELHAMAERIGMRREWFQADASTPHYDVSRTRRTAAITAGAIEVDRRGMVAIIRRLRASAPTNRAAAPSVTKVQLSLDLSPQNCSRPHTRKR